MFVKEGRKAVVWRIIAVLTLMVCFLLALAGVVSPGTAFFLFFVISILSGGVIAMENEKLPMSKDVGKRDRN